MPAGLAQPRTATPRHNMTQQPMRLHGNRLKCHGTAHCSIGVQLAARTCRVDEVAATRDGTVQHQTTAAARRPWRCRAAPCAPRHDMGRMALRVEMPAKHTTRHDAVRQHRDVAWCGTWAPLPHTTLKRYCAVSRSAGLARRTDLTKSRRARTPPDDTQHTT